MELTPSLRAWLVENCGVASDSSEEEFRKAAADSLASGQLTIAKLAELSIEESIQAQPELEEVEAKNTEVDQLRSEFQSSLADLTKTVGDLVKGQAVSAEAQQVQPSAGTKAVAAKAQQVRVVGAEERYDSSKTAAICPKGHVRSGQVAEFGGRALDMPSQLDKAISGAYFKWAVNQSTGGFNVPRQLKMTEHDNQLMEYALHKCAWSGVVGGEGTDAGGSKIDGRSCKGRCSGLGRCLRSCISNSLGSCLCWCLSLASCSSRGN